VADVDRIAVFDRAGRKVLLQSPPSVGGPAWASDDALWFSGGETMRTKSVWWGKLGHPPREIYRGAGSLNMNDASSDGRLLLTHGSDRLGVRAKPPGEQGERDLGVFSWTWAVDLSADGSQALLLEADSPRRPGALAYVGPTRGGSSVLLGEGTPMALSPKGAWALVASRDLRPRFVLTPTGPGEPHTLPLDRFDKIGAPWFLGEGQLVVDAEGGGRRSGSYVLDLPGGEPRPVTPEGITAIRGSHGDGAVIGVAPDGTLARYPLQGGDPQPLAARLPPGSIPLRVSGDGRFVFVSREPVGMPCRVDRLELATGRVTPWKTLRPVDLTGATHIIGLALTADGEAYAYTYGRYFHDLYLVEGLRP
jgi:hypothetical protein